MMYAPSAPACSPAGRRAEAADVDRDQRPAVGDLAREHRHPLVLAELRVALLDAERAEDLVDRVAVDVGVLADVDPREVKAEDLDLADDVAQHVAGDEGGVLAAQRALGDAQVGGELLGAVVAALLVGAGRCDAIGEQLEQAPVGLLGVALVHVRHERRVGELLRGGEQLAQLGRLARDARGHRDAAGERRDRLLEVRQAGVLHEPQRCGGHLGRDVRVAVAVAAHPRAERQQRRHDDVLAGVAVADRCVEVAVQRGHDLDERRGEVDEAGRDLVEDGRRDGAQLVGGPQLLDRGLDAAAHLLALAGHGDALVE
jgi:hypothetical protein